MTSTALSYEVFINDPPRQHNGALPNGEAKAFPPLATTLVHGEHDAVLVDPGFTEDQARAVGDWVEGKGRRLTNIFITHGHGDHWFNADLLARRFGARVVATEGTIAQMHANVGARPFVWDRVYPGIPDSPVTAATVPDNRFALEGHKLVIVEAGYADTDASSVLHVPDLALVVAGDVMYNGAHLYLSETSLAGLDAWRRAIDAVAALGARSIVAGHQNPALDDDAERVTAETRAYLDAAEKELAARETALDYFTAMVERYPDHRGRTVLWATAQAVYGIRANPGDDPVQHIAGAWL
ncbi:MBL fold metallo-hydrolase [Kitasatospora sp. NPDC048365]|uniref:MBL fold metallo-hydrolase n=1 Tax=Kitasatospora sp. NPDC048365 TaxID=3364050 RepID=UPI0037213EDD